MAQRDGDGMSQIRYERVTATLNVVNRFRSATRPSLPARLPPLPSGQVDSNPVRSSLSGRPGSACKIDRVESAALLIQPLRLPGGPEATLALPARPRPVPESAPGSRLAAIDIGSNSIHMIVVAPEPQRRLPGAGARARDGAPGQDRPRRGRPLRGRHARRPGGPGQDDHPRPPQGRRAGGRRRHQRRARGGQRRGVPRPGQGADRPRGAAASPASRRGGSSTAPCARWWTSARGRPPSSTSAAAARSGSPPAAASSSGGG